MSGGNSESGYNAYDGEGHLIGTYGTRQDADAAEKEARKPPKPPDFPGRDDQPPPPPGKNTELGIFGKIFTFLGCAVLLVVGIWIFGWAIATFVVK